MMGTAADMTMNRPGVASPRVRRPPRARLLAVLLAGITPALVAPPSNALAATISINVDAGTSQGAVSSLLAGQQLSWGDADGVASGVTGLSHADAVSLLQPLKIPFFRFPGGLLANCYDWTRGVGPQASRPPMPSWAFNGVGANQCVVNAAQPVDRFGTDEFMAAVNSISPGAATELTMNVCAKVETSGPACALGADGNGTSICPEPQVRPVSSTSCPGALDAADWLAYVDGTNTADPEVAARQANGHAGAYNAQYLELGNEVFSLPQSVYSNIIAAYTSTLRSRAGASGVTAPIHIGAVENGSCSYSTTASCWDGDMVRSGADFLVTHPYFPMEDDQTAQLNAPVINGAAWTRSQSWPLQVPATGSYILQAYVTDGAAGPVACTGPGSPVAAAIDGNQLASPTGTPTPTFGSETCQWPTGPLAAGPHKLTLQYTAAAAGKVAGFSSVQLCSDNACASSVPVNVGPYSSDPAAIAILTPPAAGAVSRVKPTIQQVSGRQYVTVSAYARPNPGASPGTWNCGSLDVSLGSQLALVSLSNPGAGDPCYSALNPLTVQVPFDVSTPSTRLVFAFDDNPSTNPPLEIDVTGASVSPDPTQPGSPLDLSYYQGKPPDANQELYAWSLRTGKVVQGLAQQVHSWPTAPGSPVAQAQLVASEWDLMTWMDSPASDPYPETVKGMLAEALFLEQMAGGAGSGTTLPPASAIVDAANYFTLNSAYWHVFHCDPNHEDDVTACGSPGASPYLSVPGRMFAMIAGGLGGARLNTATTADPTSSVAPDVSADYRVHWGTATSLPEVNALATRSGSLVSVMLVNVSPTDSPSVSLTLSGAGINTGAALTSLGGNPDDVDTCRHVPSGPCVSTVTAVVQHRSWVPSSGQVLSFTLPPGSFSVLTIPVS